MGQFEKFNSKFKFECSKGGREKEGGEGRRAEEGGGGKEEFVAYELLSGGGRGGFGEYC